jgi:hypothetical protein
MLTALLMFLAPHATAGDWTACNLRGAPKITDMDYHHARAALIVAGFRPVPIRSDRLADSPMVKTPRALGYHEAADCGNAACSFSWRSPNGRAFSVIVDGEWLNDGLHNGVRVMACEF